MIRFIRCATIAALAALAAVIIAPAAYAAEPQDDDITWMVRPSDGTVEDGRSWIELTLDPGQRVTEHLLVRNLSSATVTFQLSAADGYFTDTGRFNMLTSDQESVDAGTWIDIAETVDVPSGADVVVPFTLTVPENATPGDHPAGVAAAIRSGGDDEVGIESRVGFRVMTRVDGELAPSLAVAASGSYEGSWNPFEAGRLDVDYVLENTGNTRLSVAPTISVSALFGLVSFTTAGEPIPEMAPGESRSGAVRLPSVWPLFGYSAVVVAPAAAVTDELSSGEIDPVESSALVTAMPWPQMVALAIVVLLLLLLWRDRRRRENVVAARIERARQEGRDAAAVDAETARRAPAPFVGGFIVVAVLSLGLAGGGGSSAHAASGPSDDPPGITITVKIDATPAPTQAPVPVPSPAGGAASLPATGTADMAPLVAGGAAAIGMGVAAFLVRARRRRAVEANGV